MKQLKKLKLNDFYEMSDNEMKFIVGGSGSSGGSSTENKCTESGTGAKIRACKGLSKDQDCCFIYNGSKSSGRCIQDRYNTAGELYCSDAFG